LKLGLRLQIVLLLGALLAVGFVPLHFAVEAYLSAALRQSKREHGEALGHALATYLTKAVAVLPREQWGELLSSEVGQGDVRGLALYDEAGARVAVAGPQAALDHLPARLDGSNKTSAELETDFGPVLLLTDKRSHTTVASLLSREEPRAELLGRMLGLYILLIALLLLFAAYLTLTRWIVAPIGQLSLAAQRVATTARRLVAPEAPSRELAELSRSIELMTERLLSEEEALRHKVVEVERATERLRSTQAQLIRSERMASVGQLAAGLAHEVGNPIAAMIGMQDLILTGDMTQEEVNDFVRRMRKETERIHRILRDLLDFARPVRGTTEPEQAGSVEVAVNETTTLLLPQPVARNVEVELDVFPDLPGVRLRQEHLVQVLLNLLLNAAQACREGGRVRVVAKHEGSQVVIQVEDDGPGVPPELGDRIFEPFVSSKEVGEGSGLGLSVCRGLVEAAGGTIRLEPKERGARFVVGLPIAERDSRSRFDSNP
jgi:two-component system, NtrC family, sensor kinase